MTNDSAREKLLDLLDRKAFDPVLNASPSAYTSERDKEKLRDVQPGPSLTHSKSAQSHFPNDRRSNKRY